MGTDLPMYFEFTNIYELLRLLDLIVYYSNTNIVFVVGILLLYLNDLIMHHLISNLFVIRMIFY